MADAHTLLADVKRVIDELGRIPKSEEYYARGYPERQVRKHFGKWSNFIEQATSGLNKKKMPKAAKIGGAKKCIVDSLVIHELDLEELFQRAGNPASLKCIMMPDTHVEYMDVKAVRCFLQFVAWYCPDLFMIMGDFLNAGGLSHWEDACLEPKRIVPEIIRGRNLLEEIQKATPSVSSRIYLEGNHEDWINRFIGSNQNPQLFDGLEQIGFDFTLPGLLDLEKFGYDFFKMSEFVKIGLAHFVHGFYTGVNHPRKHLLKLKGNTYYGHLHDSASDTDSSLAGVIEAQSLGCLCQLRPKYLRGTANNWVHGLGAFEFFPDGTYSKLFLRIRDGKLSFAGKVFEG